jgi:hypothetical protein
MWIVGAYIKIADPENHPKPHMDSGGIMAMFFFYLWTVFYTPTWNGTPWVLNSVSHTILGKEPARDAADCKKTSKLTVFL